MFVASERDDKEQMYQIKCIFLLTYHLTTPKGAPKCDEGQKTSLDYTGFFKKSVYTKQ